MKAFHNLLLLITFCVGLTTYVDAQNRFYEHYDYGQEATSVCTKTGGGFLVGSRGNNVPFHIDENGQWVPLWHASTPSSDYIKLLPTDSGYIAGFFDNNTQLQLEKRDLLGNLQWSTTKNYPVGSAAHNRKTRFLEPLNDSTFLLGGRYQENGNSYPQNLLVCFDETGDTLWSWADTSFTEMYDMCPAANGDIWLLYDNHLATWLRRLDANGTVVDSVPVPADNFLHQPNFDDYDRFNRTLVATPDGGMMMVTSHFSVDERISLFRFDANGDTLWTRFHDFNAFDQSPFLTMMPSGNFFVSLTGGFGEDIVVMKFLASGHLISRIEYPHPPVSLTRGEIGDVVLNEMGGVTIAIDKAWFTGDDGISLLSTDSLGNLYDNRIKGRVYDDANSNCTFESSEPRLSNFALTFQGGGSTQYAYTSASGEYQFFADSGSYQISATAPNPYWSAACNTSVVNLNLGNGLGNGQVQTTVVDFPQDAITNCPYLTVDLSAPLLRRCFDSNYHINYCNSGTQAVPGAQVEITFDPFLSVQSSTIPWISQQGNTYIFDVGALAVGDCGNFSVTVYVDCNSTVLGQSHCSEATIGPDTSCIAPHPSWDGAELSAEVKCLNNDSVALRFTNIGAGDMSVPVNFFVVEDDIMIQNSTLQLVSGQTWEQLQPANGSAWYIEGGQTPFYNGYRIPSDFLEGCGVNGNGTFSLGHSNQFPDDDLAPYHSIDCQPNIGAYDPNDKRGIPLGYSGNHYIDSTDRIDYHVRFQNTGSDTAFTIVVRDTLSYFLDPATIVPGAASHPYSFTIQPPNVLEFTFNHILLPDSNVNEPGSHGFIKFAIEQRPGNLPGTLIENQADIYFDFNAPVITNTAFHQIAEEFITVSLEEIALQNTALQLQVAPHPLTDRAIISLIGAPHERWTLELYTIEGRKVESFTSMGNTVEISRGHLAAGVYAMRVKGDGGAVMASGKLVVR